MGYMLTIEPLGATLEVEEGQTLLDAALRQGIYLPHACGHGLTMQPFSVTERRFDGMPEGVAQIEDSAQPGFGFVAGDDRATVDDGTGSTQRVTVVSSTGGTDSLTIRRVDAAQAVLDVTGWFL